MITFLKKLFKPKLKPNEFIVQVTTSPLGVRLLGRKNMDSACFDLLNNILGAGAINLPHEYREELRVRKPNVIGVVPELPPRSPGDPVE